MRLYRRTRQRVLEILQEIKDSGYDRVRIQGEGDIAEICRLTCLEQGVTVVEDSGVPVLEVHGTRVQLLWEVKV
jgi:hypothetical protein